MDDIKYIRRLYEIEGVSIREIVKRTGYNYRTIRKYLDMDDFNEPFMHKREMTSQLDPLKPVIDQWLTEDKKLPRKQRHTGQRVYTRLYEEYPDELTVSLRTVQKYVAEKKKELWKENSDAFLPLVHPDGEAQGDFGKFAYYDNSGQLHQASKLTLAFPQSNCSFCQTFRRENQECLLQGLKNIFVHMGLVPERIIFDNLSAAVFREKNGQRKLNEKFQRFCEHYRFEPVFCNPAAGWEKGNVENKVGYERRNLFVPVPTILDFDQFNQDLFEACEKDMHREHYSKGIELATLFESDRKAMHPVNPKPFDIDLVENRICDKYGKVRFEGNLYSISPKFAKRSVIVKAGSDSLRILDENFREIINHPRLYGKGLESMKWVPYLELMSQRPTALKYTSFYSELPQNWVRFLDSQDYDSKKKALNLLSEMLKEHDMQIASRALENTLAMGVSDLGSIRVSYRNLTCQNHIARPLKLEGIAPEVPIFKPDNSRYDSLFDNAKVRS